MCINPCNISVACRLSGAPRQALGVWQWHNFLETNVPDGKELVLLNLDETCVPLFHGDQKGNVIARRRKGDPQQQPVQKATRREMRACVTHVAVIASAPAVQQLLPQDVLGNCSVLLARDITALKDELPPNVNLVRGKSGWTNAPYLCKLMPRIAAAVRRAGEHYWPVLLMDCARQHLHVSVLRAAARCHIRLVFIPAKLTWLLQPCDTHVFMKYKRELRAQYQDGRAAAEDGRVTVRMWLRMIVRTIIKVMESTDWQAAFRADGFGDNQLGTSRYVLTHLDGAAMIPADNEEPTRETLAALLPAGTKFNENILLGRPTRTPTSLHVPRSLPPARHGALAAEHPDTSTARTDVAAVEEVQTCGHVALPRASTAASSGSATTPVHTPHEPWQTAAARSRPRAAASGAVPSPTAAPAPSIETPSVEGPIWRRTRSRTSDFARGL